MRPAGLTVLRVAAAVGLAAEAASILQVPGYWPRVAGGIGLAFLAPYGAAVAGLNAAAAVALALGVVPRLVAASFAGWMGARAALELALPGGSWTWQFAAVVAGILVPVALLGPGRFALANAHPALAVAPRGRLADLARAAEPYAMWPFRVALPAVLFFHYGVDKVVRFDEWVGIFEAVGIPFAATAVVLVATAELLGPFGIFAGILVRFSSAVLAVILVVAIAVAWWPLPITAGWYFDLVLLGGVLALAIGGPGRPTLASVLGPRFADPEERAVALVRR